MEGIERPKRRHDKRPGADVSESLRRYHASRTEQQRAAWRAKVRLGTSVGMDQWHAGRTAEQREHSRQLQTDAAVARIWFARQPGTKFQKGHDTVASNESLERREFARVRAASIKRILKEIVEEDPEMIRRAIRDGIKAPPPRSFPYLAIAAAYLDGRPVEANDDLHTAKQPDLSELTRDELRRRALAIARKLAQATPNAPLLPVIDVTPEPTQ